MSETIAIKIEMHMENIETYTKLNMRAERKKEFLKLKAYLQALRDVGQISYQKYVDYLKETYRIMRKRGNNANNKDKRPAKASRIIASAI